MDDQHWPRVKELFGEALSLSPAERGEFLDRECVHEPDLRTRLDALLKAHDDADTFLEGGAGAVLVSEAREAAGAEEGGERIGPYRLLEEIGRGGMGSVRLAVRADDAYRQRVAIKLIKRGMDSDEIVRRFENERQILAGLVHPGIARLLDGGTTEDGRPYFVMEAIEGRPIDRYCEEESLDLDRRLRLFLVVCRAVAFAHRNLVVHRDLKPANILVTDDGEPRLLDFGIAKLLGPDLAAGPLVPTLVDRRPMTPEYASPEQLLGAPVTTLTDVYGLGLLLYVLLTGRHPFAGADAVSGSPTVVERIVAGRLRPPSRLKRSISTADRPAQPSHDRSRGPALELDADLDAVVLQAMAVEPERRYGSVQELIVDIEHYMNARPVSARRPTLRYRLGKFVRRHKVGTAFAASVVIAAMVFVAQSFEVARQRDLAQAQRRVAETERGLAEAERNRAQSLSGFLIDLFVVADPSQSRGEEVTARELLDEGARRLLLASDDDVAGLAPRDDRIPPARPVPGLARSATPRDPETRADLLHAIGLVYHNLQLLDPARQVLEQSLAIRPESDDLTSVEKRADTLIRLGHVDRVLGDHAAAASRYGEARRLLLSHVTEDDPALAGTDNALGLLAKATGDLDLAAEHLDRAVRARRSAQPGSLDLADSLSNLAAVETERRNLAQAETLLAEARELHRDLLGDDHPRLANELGNLAALAFQTGDFERAEALFSDARDLRRRILGSEHPDLAVTLSNLAVVQHRNGRLDGAEASLREALAIHRGRYRTAHPDLADTLNNLAAVVHRRGALDEAVTLYREAETAYREIHGPRHPRIANVLDNLAQVYRDQGDLVRALELAERALAMSRASLGPRDPSIAGRLGTVASLLRRTGDLDGARERYREAVLLRSEVLPEDHPDLAFSLIGLGSVLLEQGRAAEAQPLLERALDLRRAALAPEHPQIATAQSVLGACYSDLGRLDEAELLLTTAVERLTGARGSEHPETEKAAERLDRLRSRRP